MKPIALLMIGVSLIAAPFPGQGQQTGSEKNSPADRQDQIAKVIDPGTVREEVRKAFNEWKDAYAEGDTKEFLLGFAQIPDLTIRISGNEWIGWDNYRAALAQVEMPKTGFPFRNIRIIPIDEFSAYVTYIRSSAASDENGKPLSYRGTLIYAKTYSGWKVIAWHTHALLEPEPRGPEFRQ